MVYIFYILYSFIYVFLQFIIENSNNYSNILNKNNNETKYLYKALKLLTLFDRNSNQKLQDFAPIRTKNKPPIVYFVTLFW